MEKFLSIAFVLATIALYLLVAFFASKKVKSESDYLLGGRSFGLFSTTLTLLATQVGAGMIFGTAFESYKSGIAGMSYNLGMAIGFLLLAFGMAKKLRVLNITTTAQIFETKYNSTFLRKLAGLISAITMGGILAAQIVASKKLFISLMPLDISWLIIFWVVIIFYTMFGGIRAVVATDKLQILLIVSIFVCLFFYLIPISKINTISLLPPTEFDFNFPSFLKVMIPTVMFSLIEQDLALRFFSSKDESSASKAAFLACVLFLLFAFIPMYLGIYARVLGFLENGGESPFILLLKDKLSLLPLTIVSSALLAAICSTADSLLGAASTNLLVDFNTKEKKHSLFYARSLTFFVGIAALIIGFYFDNIIAIIIKSYELSVAALFVPTIGALFSKKNNKYSAYLSVFAGFFSFIFLEAFSFSDFSLFISSALSLFGYLVGKYFFKNY